MLRHLQRVPPHVTRALLGHIRPLLRRRAFLHASYAHLVLTQLPRVVKVYRRVVHSASQAITATVYILKRNAPLELTALLGQVAPHLALQVNIVLLAQVPPRLALGAHILPRRVLPLLLHARQQSLLETMQGLDLRTIHSVLLVLIVLWGRVPPRYAR